MWFSSRPEIEIDTNDEFGQRVLNICRIKITSYHFP